MGLYSMPRINCGWRYVPTELNGMYRQGCWGLLVQSPSNADSGLWSAMPYTEARIGMIFVFLRKELM